FSSRRRHTRSDRDWSSDVCSSDLSLTFSAPFSVPEATLFTPFLVPSLTTWPIFFAPSTVPSAAFSEPLATSLPAFFVPLTTPLRSEERRVGKECSSGRSQSLRSNV